jgi:hypothetical protein
MKPPAIRGPSTALRFGAGASDRVDCGSGASMDNITDGTVLAWFYADDVANTFKGLVSKLNSPAASQGWQFNRVAASGSTLRLIRHRSIGNQIVSSPASQILAGAWNFGAASWDITGGAPKMYHGTLLAPAADVSTSVTAGSGTQVDDSAGVLTLGNYGNSAIDSAWPGRVALVAVVNRILTPAEVQSWQFRPRALRGCVGFWQLGRTGTSTQLDYSGNGNHGTVTGATVAQGPPTRQVRKRKFAASVAAPAGGNRRRRVLIGSAA